MKFRSDVAGSVTGIRFYKTSAMAGTHTGRLWSTTGVNLATVTFAGESATGWQQATFSSPVAINPNVTYVASYHTTANFARGNQFTTAVDRAPLHALQNQTGDPNGVYKYGNGGVYPNDTYSASNYLVDVVFVPAGPDTTAPTIIQRTPAPAATGVAVTSNVTVGFSEAITAGSITTTNVVLRDPANAVVAATVSYDSATRSAVLDPTASPTRPRRTRRRSRVAPVASPISPASRSPPTAPGRSRRPPRHRRRPRRPRR